MRMRKKGTNRMGRRKGELEMMSMAFEITCTSHVVFEEVLSDSLARRL